MRVAIVAITKHGAEIAAKIDGERFVSAKFRSALSANYFDKPIKDLTAQLWGEFDALVYIVSLGAVVRTIAPFLKDKHVDPAVLVVDDKAQFVISVLSGHVGGANELAEKIAGTLGAKAIITTASDVGKTIPVDILGRELGWTTELDQNVTRVSAAVVNEEPVALVQETGEPGWWKRDTPLPKNIHLKTLEEAKPYRAVLLISDRIVEQKYADLMDRMVIYRPRSLVLGIGCDRGVTCDQIEEFVFEQMAGALLSFRCVRNVASLDLKRGEPGLQEFCQKHRLSLVCFGADELKGISVPTPSATVEKYAGTPSVSEAAALKSSGGTLVVTKQKTRMLTLAIARVMYGG